VLGPLLQLSKLLCLQIDTRWRNKHDVSGNVRLPPPLCKQLLKPLRLLHQRDARQPSERGGNVNNMPVKSVHSSSYLHRQLRVHNNVSKLDLYFFQR
jgi:hypothetical protein